VRASNGISYLTARFSGQNRLGALQALKRLNASATDCETGFAPAEIALVWVLLTGSPGGWTVTNIAAGHSGGRLRTSGHSSLGSRAILADKAKRRST
jgi:hypothetical protein